MSLTRDSVPLPRWSDRPWTDFHEKSSAKPQLAILPICSYLKRGEDQPLDCEHRWIDATLRSTLTNDSSCIQILPTFDRVPQLLPHQFFGTSVTAASESLFEIIDSVAQAGVEKIAFILCNEALADWSDTVARELRVKTGIHPFTVNLDALGLSFSPDGSPTLSNDTSQRFAAMLDEIIAFPPITPFSPKPLP